MHSGIVESDVAIIDEAIDSLAAIFITDIEGRILYINDKFCERSEYSRSELIGQPIRMLKSGFHTQEFYQEFWSKILSGQSWEGIFCNKTKSGKLIWLETIIKPIIKDGKIEKFIGVRLNVTDKIKNAKELKDSEEKLIEISKFAAIGEISGFIAHEIKNPLTVMKLAINSLNLALDAQLPDLEKVKKLNNKINDVSDRISKIVYALGNYSRHESTSLMEPHKIIDIIDDVLLITEDLAKSDGIKISVSSNIENNFSLKCHKTKISQVIMNLVKNACDAVHSLPKKEVTLKINLIDDLLEIRVLDSGNKIPDSIAENLFTPYFTTKKEGEGTGIGLTISQKIVIAHGGKLFLDRECDQTCFVIILPLKK